MRSWISSLNCVITYVTPSTPAIINPHGPAAANVAPDRLQSDAVSETTLAITGTKLTATNATPRFPQPPTTLANQEDVLTNPATTAPILSISGGRSLVTNEPIAGASFSMNSLPAVCIHLVNFGPCSVMILPSWPIMSPNTGSNGASDLFLKPMS